MITMHSSFTSMYVKNVPQDKILHIPVTFLEVLLWHARNCLCGGPCRFRRRRWICFIHPTRSYICGFLFFTDQTTAKAG